MALIRLRMRSLIRALAVRMSEDTRFRFARLFVSEAAGNMTFGDITKYMAIVSF